MARMSTEIFRRTHPLPQSPAALGPEARQHMIAEAAYYHYVHRGYAPGHELEDWVAAEAEIEQASRELELPEMYAIPALEVQQGGTYGPAEDDVLKRTTKAHPGRDIPRFDSIEPGEPTPAKE